MRCPRCVPARPPAEQAAAWSPDDDASTSPVAAIGRSGRGSAAASPAADPRMPYRQTGAASSALPAADERPGGASAGEGTAAAGPTGSDEPGPTERTMGIRRVDASGGSWKRQVRELAGRDAAGALPAQQGPVRPTPATAQPPAPGTPGQGPQHHQPGAGLPQARAELPPGGHGLSARPVPAPGHLAGSAAGQPAFPAPAQPFGAEGTAASHGPGGAAPLRPVQPLALSATAPWETNLGQAYPAGLGRRLTARVLDSLLPLAAAAAVAWPLVDRARDHVQRKIEAVEQAGVTDTVWLLDTTTAGYLGLVLGAMLLVSLVLEAVPSAVWGRSPGKAATGLRLATMDGHDKPGAGSTLVRWLTYSVLGVLLVGLLNVVWCLWDRPWRQCWHDKVAGTFVAAVRRRE